MHRSAVKHRLVAWLGVVLLIAVGVRSDEGSGENPEPEPDLELDWDENPDYATPDVHSCLFGSTAGREELAEVKTELQNLRSTIEGLRAKLDPNFDAVPLPDKTGKRCAHGFHYLPKANSCYKIVYEEHNWTSADESCRMLHPDAHLVAITTKKENEALKRYLDWDLQSNSMKNICMFHDWGDRQKMLWTGGHRRNSNCSEPFVWQLSPTQGEPLVYGNWIEQEPNCWSKNEKCVHIRSSHTYRWNDVQCERKLCPICEYDPKKTD